MIYLLKKKICASLLLHKKKAIFIETRVGIGDDSS